MRKVDTTNPQQMQRLLRCFRHNMAAVDFWLAFCVLPAETGQYPKRLAASAWHLADGGGAAAGGGVVGFSGTNDNKLLLPLQVHQAAVPGQPALATTNGFMLHMLLCTAAYGTLAPQVGAVRRAWLDGAWVHLQHHPALAKLFGPEPGGPLPAFAAQAGKPLWEVLLDRALEQGLDALLDCGALLAGVGNRSVAGLGALLLLLAARLLGQPSAMLHLAKGSSRPMPASPASLCDPAPPPDLLSPPDYCRVAAQHVVQHMDQARYQGACFYDQDKHAWTILAPDGRCLPRHTSPIAERDTFVIFDDAHCRGADLQLRPQAVGLLTLGPGICKDKLMQAAGRLRQLGPGRQTLRVVGVPDVTAKIWAAAGGAGGGEQQPGMGDVLRWVMANTVEALLGGVAEWAAKGLHFATTAGCASRALLDEAHELEQLYGGAKARQPVAAVVEALALQQLGRLEAGGPEPLELAAARGLAAEVQQRSGRCGEGHSVVAGWAADEECERELEKEEEQEEEKEVQVARAKPAKEADWEYARAAAAASAADLAGSGGGPRLVQLAAAAATLEPPAVGRLPWSGRVFCTANCLYTTQPAMDAAAAGAASRAGGLNDYLRPLDAALLLPSGEAVLLSEREADGLMEVLWGVGSGVCNRGSGGAVLLSLPLTGLPVVLGGGGSGGRPPLAVALAADAARQPGGQPPAWGPAARELVSMRLFGGAASYEGGGQAAELAALVKGRRQAAEALVGARGLLPLFPRSDLERACDGWAKR